MKLALEQEGGISAGVRQPATRLDSTLLSEDQLSELRRMLAQLKEASRIPVVEPNRTRDAVIFTITVEEQGDRGSYCQADMHMTEAFADLKMFIQTHARPASDS